MGGAGTAADSRAAAWIGARLLLLRAEGCIVCVGLDAVEGVFEGLHVEAGRAMLPEGRSISALDWPQVSGVGRSASSCKEPRPIAVVRTERGSVGLQVDSCLGVRDVSFLESPPVPTRLLDTNGAPLCYLFVLDGRPHFLIEPRALVHALDEVARPADAEANGLARARASDG